MDRRKFAQVSAGAAVSALLPACAGAGSSAAQVASSPAPQDTHDMAAAMQKHAALLTGPHLTIAMLPYPGMFLQDFIGPLTMFEALLNRDIHVVWKDTAPMDVGSGMRLTPTTTLAACPADVDVLFVPGGVPVTFTMMEDADVLAFLASRGALGRRQAVVVGPAQAAAR